MDDPMFTPDVLDLFDQLLASCTLGVGADDFEQVALTAIKAKQQIVTARGNGVTVEAEVD